MRRISLLCFVVLLLSSAETWAEQHPACSGVDYPLSASSAELRLIAVSCEMKSVSRLFYQRAYFKDLLKEAETFSSLIAYPSKKANQDSRTHRFYMALIEAFAPVWYPDFRERVKFLNAEYDRRGRITELRLRGYDTIADRMEQKG